MTTDDNIGQIEPVTINTEVNQPSETKTEEKTQSILTEEKINELINAKFTEVAEKHQKEIEELNNKLTEKDKEIERLTKVNQQIVLSTNVEQSKKDIVDFSKVDFDEVDWDEQSKNYMSKIDAKIFS